MMTKYSVSAYTKDGWEGVALFSDKADFNAMVEFCIEQFQNANSTLPCEHIAITDIETGEILWDINHDYEEGIDPYPEDEDCGFDPYMGCYTDDC